MKKILLLPFLCIVALVTAQKFHDLPKISQADFNVDQPSLNPDAPAEILFRSARHIVMTNTGYDYRMESTYITRIRVYNKEKVNDLLNPEIPIYETSGDRQKLTGFSAVTYNLENGKIVTTKVEGDSKYRSKEDKNYVITKFAFPNVKDGSIVEYKYTVYSPERYLWMTPQFMVERELPQRYVEYFLDTPRSLGYNINYKGILVPSIRETAAKDLYGTQYQVYRFAYENVPAYKEEKYVLNNNNYMTSIKAELNSYNIGSEYKSFSMSWNDIRKRLNEDEEFGLQLKKQNLVKNILPEDIKKISNPKERAAAILKFVQRNYTWNKEVSLWTGEGIRNLLNTKIGNSAEINLLLVMLMRDAGLDANPIVGSTVSRGIITGYSPTITQLNYVFASVLMDDVFYYYDGTSKYGKTYELPRRALNETGVLLTDKEAKVVNVYYPGTSKTFLTVDAKLNPDATFSGNFSDHDTKLYAAFNNEEYNNNKEEYQKIYYRDRYKFPITELKTQTLENGDIETGFDFHSDSFVDVIGTKLVFNPLLFLYTKNHDFDQTETRKAPLQFYSASEKVKKVTITLPDGYVFENLPKGKKIKTEDGTIAYSYIPTQEGNTLTVESVLLIGGESFPAEYYQAFKQIFDNITQMEGQVVTAVRK